MPTIDKFEYDELKDCLLKDGFLLPCGGNGVCGRCKITAPKLALTSLDLRFLSKSEIESGIRLACDKKTFDGLTIDCSLNKSETKIKLEKAQIVALIGEKDVTLCLVDDTLISVSKHEIIDKSTLSLRSVIGKNAIEFFEHYGIAKAEEMLILGGYDDIVSFSGGKLAKDFMKSGEYYDAAMFDMPSELVYLAPVGNKQMGSLNLLRVSCFDNNSLVFIAENATMIFKGENSIICSQIPIFGNLKCDINDGIFSNEVKLFFAFVKYFVKSFNPDKAYIIGFDELDFDRLNAMIDYNKLTFLRDKVQDAESSTKLILNPRFKTALNKLAKKAEEVKNIIEDDLFQSFITL